MNKGTRIVFYFDVRIFSGFGFDTKNILKVKQWKFYELLGQSNERKLSILYIQQNPFY